MLATRTLVSTSRPLVATSRTLTGVRHNSTIPTLIKYFDDKAIRIPLSRWVLQPEEERRYRLYREIKLGHVEKVTEQLRKYPLMPDEEKNLLEWVEELRDQPYSIPNFLIGYWCFQGSMYLGQYTLMGWDAFSSLQELTHSTLIPVALGAGSLLPIGLLLKFGFHTVYDEFRSPYYNYEAIVRAIKQAPKRELPDGEPTDTEDLKE